MNEIEKYLHQVNSILSDKQKRLYEFYITNMQYFTKDDTYINKTKRDFQYIENAIPKNCYNNCKRIAKTNHKFRYYEGFYMVEGLDWPTEHGFLVTNDGKIFDPTSERLNFNVTLYGGIEIPREMLKLNTPYSQLVDLFLEKDKSK